MITELGAHRLTTAIANPFGAAAGITVAIGSGLAWWSIPLALLAGTLGWFVGWFLGRRIGRALQRTGYAPTGQALYRLRRLPPGETSAGGKARSLSRLMRAGQRVPDGFVVLPPRLHRRPAH